MAASSRPARTPTCSRGSTFAALIHSADGLAEVGERGPGEGQVGEAGVVELPGETASLLLNQHELLGNAGRSDVTNAPLGRIAAAE